MLNVNELSLDGVEPSLSTGFSALTDADMAISGTGPTTPLISPKGWWAIRAQASISTKIEPVVRTGWRV